MGMAEDNTLHTAKREQNRDGRCAIHDLLRNDDAGDDRSERPDSSNGCLTFSRAFIMRPTPEKAAEMLNGFHLGRTCRPAELIKHDSVMQAGVSLISYLCEFQ